MSYYCGENAYDTMEVPNVGSLSSTAEQSQGEWGRDGNHHWSTAGGRPHPQPWPCTMELQPGFHSVWVLVAQSHPTLSNTVDCTPPGSSSVHGILQAEHWGVLPCLPAKDLPDPGLHRAAHICRTE